MSTILLVGVGPLATDPRASSGPQFRTTDFWQVLRSAGHVVHLASLGGDDVADSPERALEGGGKMREFSPDAMLNVDALRQWAMMLKPDAIVGCGTTLPGAAAGRLNDIAPVWIDLAGDPIAEVQVKARAYPDEPYETLLHHVWKLTQTCLRKADRLSGVSRAHCHALIGMLGLLGRLNRETADAPMIHNLPIGPPPRLTPTSQIRLSRLRGVKCPDDAFLVAWSGSYNTWIDADLLFEGLSLAMERIPTLHYVSTGGGSAGYNEGIYAQFAERVNSSPLADRFHLLGWLDRDEAEAIHAQCDIGLNVDRWCYEGILGARNRITAFLDLGLPVATTALAEISCDLIVCGGALEIPLANPQGMARTLENVVQDRGLLIHSLEKGRAYLRENSFLACATPLLAWARQPVRAGDFRSEGYANAVAERTDYEAIDRMLVELNECRQSQSQGLFRRVMKRLF